MAAPPPPFLRRLAAALATPPALLPAPRRAAVAIILRVVGEAPDAFPPPGATLAAFLGSRAAAAPAARVEALFIRRAERAGDPWSGHVAFPGGKREAGDADDVATAAREAREETGVDAARDLLLVGRLADRRAFAGGRALPGMAFCVAVFVAPRPYAPALALEPGEVAAARWVPVAALSAEKAGAAGIERPALRALLPPEAVARVPRWMRLGAMRLPAIDLPAGEGAGAGAGDARDARDRFLLWGMTLQAASDLVEAAGGARLAWPPVHLRWPWQAAVLVACGAADVADVVRGRRSVWGVHAPAVAAAAAAAAAAVSLAAWALRA